MSAAKEENMSEDPAIIILESDGKKLQSFVRFLAEFVGPRYREPHNELLSRFFQHVSSIWKFSYCFGLAKPVPYIQLIQ